MFIPTSPPITLKIYFNYLTPFNFVSPLLLLFNNWLTLICNAHTLLVIGPYTWTWFTYQQLYP